MVNPFESPPNDSPLEPPAAPDQPTRQSWPVSAAVIWIVFLFLLLPAIHCGRVEKGHFLWFKIATTAFSALATYALVAVPRRAWKLLTLPLVALLVFIQWTAWTRLP